MSLVAALAPFVALVTIWAVALVPTNSVALRVLSLACALVCAARVAYGPLWQTAGQLSIDGESLLWQAALRRGEFALVDITTIRPKRNRWMMTAVIECRDGRYLYVAVRNGFTAFIDQLLERPGAAAIGVGPYGRVTDRVPTASISPDPDDAGKAGQLSPRTWAASSVGLVIVGWIASVVLLDASDTNGLIMLAGAVATASGLGAIRLAREARTRFLVAVPREPGTWIVYVGRLFGGAVVVIGAAMLLFGLIFASLPGTD